MSLALVATSRRVSLDGAFNFRDVGGYRGDGGRLVRWHRLYRSDGPHGLTSSDAQSLNRLNLRSIVDLRSPGESPARFIEVVNGARSYELPMVNIDEEIPGFDSWSDPAFVATRYLALFSSGEESLIELIAILTDARATPALVHCTAGKDRTGIAIAMILSLLGVSDEDIVSDYSLSASAMKTYVGWLSRQYPDGADRLQEMRPALLAAAPDSMRIFLRDVRRTLGSFEHWIATVGMGSAVRYLRASLLTRPE